MNFFIIADTHFGYAGIIHLYDRPFDSVDEVDYRMIMEWNKRVA